MGIKHTDKRVVIEMDIQSKNWHTFASGQKIRLERQNNELNRRVSEPVNATIVSADQIPIGATVAIHPNAVHDVNRLFNYKPLSGDDIASEIRYYSIPETDCFLYIEKGGTEWKPCPNFAIGLRVFQPYVGVISGIPPTKIKNVLFITSGALSGNVCHTLKACDYEIVAQGLNGTEERIIRCRHSETDDNYEREEIVAIDHELTKKVKKGELNIGLTPSDCKPLTEIV